MRRVFFFPSPDSSSPSRRQNDPPSRAVAARRVFVYVRNVGGGNRPAALPPRPLSLCRRWHAAVYVPRCGAQPTTNSTAAIQWHTVYRPRFSTCVRFGGRASRHGRRVWPSLPPPFTPRHAADRPRVSKPNTMLPSTQPVGGRGGGKPTGAGPVAERRRRSCAAWPVPPNPRPGRVTK